MRRFGFSLALAKVTSRVPKTGWGEGGSWPFLDNVQKEVDILICSCISTTKMGGGAAPPWKIGSYVRVQTRLLADSFAKKAVFRFYGNRQDVKIIFFRE